MYFVDFDRIQTFPSHSNKILFNKQVISNTIKQYIATSNYSKNHIFQWDNLRNRFYNPYQILKNQTHFLRSDILLLELE